MSCPGCGARTEGSERFCRKCGANLPVASGARAVEPFRKSNSGGELAALPKKDPDELTGNGVASFFIGDGFFFPAILLSVLDSSVKSWLWLLMLIPAFFFFGRGFRDVWQARQARRRLKLDETAGTPELNAPAPVPSAGYVTERTTRQLR